MKILTTENLTLREFEITDADMFFYNNQDDSIKRFLDYRYYARTDDALRSIKEFILRYPTKDLPYYLAIVKTETNQLIGHIGIGKMQDEVELEFSLGKDFRGHHFSSEAIIAFITWCKTNLIIKSIYAIVDPENIASCRVLENAGFTIIDDEHKLEFNLRNKQRMIFYYCL